ncbi:hypothetical protein SLS59_005167 [Nothophoma quercina]|uniref:Uncharacterized protein n=1 Tax=Nothophoma quercina TaxID=749835 RepID=A0ABR3RC35_9PLEO
MDNCTHPIPESSIYDMAGALANAERAANILETWMTNTRQCNDKALALVVAAVATAAGAVFEHVQDLSDSDSSSDNPVLEVGSEVENKIEDEVESRDNDKDDADADADDEHDETNEDGPDTPSVENSGAEDLPRVTPAPTANTGKRATPASDPVIDKVAARASSNRALLKTMKVVAAGEASREQLDFFQQHIDELEKEQEASAANTRSKKPRLAEEKTQSLKRSSIDVDPQSLTDSSILDLTAQAQSDRRFKNTLKTVAAGDATQDQLDTLQTRIEEAQSKNNQGVSSRKRKGQTKDKKSTKKRREEGRRYYNGIVFQDQNFKLQGDVKR